MTDRSWIYHMPEFECDSFNEAMMKYSPWSGHRYFGYDFVANYKPGIIAELGSYYGCSSFTFLQAVKDFGLSTRFYSIDSWKGDSFTKNDYREDIYGKFMEVLHHCYPDQHAAVLKMTFDEAAERFHDETIDLLHIDGSHYYQDVKHDFETWAGKVKKNGVIFFHDISDDELFGREMGSHIFWEELRERYPYTFSFPFSYGLGVLFREETAYAAFLQNIDADRYQKLANTADNINKDILRRNYFRIRDLESYISELKNTIDKYKRNVQGKDQYIAELQDTIGKYEATVQGKDGYIVKLQDLLKSCEAELAERN